MTSRRARSGQSPLPLSLPTSGSCLQPSFIAPGAESALRDCLVIINMLSTPADTVARAMLVTGARIHEILQVEVRDVADTGHLLVRAGKGSDPRVVYCPELLPFKQRALALNQPRLFYHYSYWKFRRALRKALPSLASPKERVRLITNLFRRGAAELADSFPGADHALAQRFLGHRAASSTLYYLSRTRRLHHG